LRAAHGNAVEIERKPAMMPWQRMRIAPRLYAGFGMLVLLGVATAVIGTRNLDAIAVQSNKMNAVAGNTARVLKTVGLLEAERRALLRYKTSGEEAALADAKEKQAQVVELLKAAAAATISPERLRIHNDLQGRVAAHRALVDKLEQLTTTLR
jgi:hypothetical protein